MALLNRCFMERATPTDSWHSVLHDSLKLDMVWEKLVQRNLMSPETKTSLAAKRGELIPYAENFTKDNTQLLIELDMSHLKQLYKDRAKHLRTNCQTELRIYANIIARLATLLFFKYDSSLETYLNTLSELEEIQEILSEWRYVNELDHSVLVEQLTTYLMFQAELYRLTYESSHDDENVKNLYEEYRNTFDFASSFILVDNLLKPLNIPELAATVKEDYKRYENNANLYHVQARLSVYDILTKNAEYQERKFPERSLKSRLMSVKETYQAGIKKTNSSDIWAMWRQTADDLLNASNGTPFYKSLMEFYVYSMIHLQKNKQLSEKCTKIFLERISYDHEQYSRAVTNATIQYPQNAGFWCHVLRYHISHYTNNLDSIIINFHRALKELTHGTTEELFEVFETMYGFLILIDPISAEEIFILGLDVRPELGKYILIPYLHYIHAMNGITSCRAMLDKPYISNAPREFFFELALLEKRSACPNSYYLRKCFNTGIRFFGATDLSFWEESLRLELADGCLDRAKLVYQRARTEYRSGCELPQFPNLEKFSLFKAVRAAVERVDNV